MRTSCMRINKFVALATGLSRRAADSAINSGRVSINGHVAIPGIEVTPSDEVHLDETKLELPVALTTIILNKPIGYVCSRSGQGSKTVYDLLPQKYRNLKPVGRLDKDSSGLILLTDDGELANKLTHPRYQKNKVYEVKLNKSLNQDDLKQLLTGVNLSDGLSKFIKVNDCSNNTYEVSLREGRNRQIRRTFNALGYKVIKLHRSRFGNLNLYKNLSLGGYSLLTNAGQLNSLKD